MKEHPFVTQRDHVAEVRSTDSSPDQDDNVEQWIPKERWTGAAEAQLQTASQRTT
jgi:hypothetical protein